MRWMDYYREQIKENIDYDLLQRDYPHRMEHIDGYVELMAETCCTGRETVRVNGENMPAAMVWDRLLKLDRAHICYVIDAMCGVLPFSLGMTAQAGLRGTNIVTFVPPSFRGSIDNVPPHMALSRWRILLRATCGPLSTGC